MHQPKYSEKNNKDKDISLTDSSKNVYFAFVKVTIFCFNKLVNKSKINHLLYLVFGGVLFTHILAVFY